MSSTHGLSQVPAAVPPIPRSTHGPDGISWPSRGVKEEQGERGVLTRAGRDTAGLGLQPGALAGFPSAPRGRAAPRPGPGPSPAGHRAQAPWGPLLPGATNCNTAQRPRLLLLLPAPRGPAHRRPLVPQDRGVGQSPSPLCVPPSRPSPSPEGSEPAAVPLPLPALLQRQLWVPAPAAHVPPHQHTAQRATDHTDTPGTAAPHTHGIRGAQLARKGAGTIQCMSIPKDAPLQAASSLQRQDSAVLPVRREAGRHLRVLEMQSPGNIPGSAGTAAPQGPSDPQCPTRDRRTHHTQTGPVRPLASHPSAPAHNLPQSPEQLSPLLPRASGDPPSHRPDSRPTPHSPSMERGHQHSCFQGKTPSSSTGALGHPFQTPPSLLHPV